jgi:hypothetical protein
MLKNCAKFLATRLGLGVGIRYRTVQVQDEQQSTVRRGKAGRWSPSPWPAHLAWLGGEVSSSLLEVATTKAARAGPDGHVMGVHTPSVPQTESFYDSKLVPKKESL